MEDIEFKDPNKYEYQIVSTEKHDCECGKTHDEGDAIWGGIIHPENISGSVDPMETVTGIHSAPVEIRHY